MVAALVGLGGCPKPSPNPAYPDASDAAAACTAAADVCAYCAHMRSLGCEEGRPTASGASCETVTANVQRNGFIAMDLACRARVSCQRQSDCK
jgi:hypothetical protein